jgi:type I site-specific restriction endonuclease
MSPNEAEWKTRKKRIDPSSMGRVWPVRKGRAKPEALRSGEEETDNGPAGYALWLDDQMVAVVEAKKLTVGPQNVLTWEQLSVLWSMLTASVSLIGLLLCTIVDGRRPRVHKP